MIIYRIEDQNNHDGMWYKANGDFSPFILNLTEGLSKNAPMQFNGDHKEHGLNWCSAVHSKDQMNQWFSPLDALELYENNYRLFEFEVERFKIKDHEVLFTRESILRSNQMSLDGMWDMSSIRKLR